MITITRNDRQATGSPAPAVPATPAPFAELGISDQLVAELRRGGITEPFPIQTATIADALAGRDICGKARTGSGKTLAFGLPLVERTQRSRPRHPESLVLVPTRELALQVVTELEPLARLKKLRVLPVYGGVSLGRQADLLSRGIDIVVATPGRLNDLLQRGDVSVAAVSRVVIDEADQMADLGFLPQVERILRRIEGQHQTLLFSATLDGMIDTLVRRYQHDPLFHEVETPIEDTLAMKHRFISVTEQDRVAISADIAAGSSRTLLFVRTQRGAKRLVQDLHNQGVEAGMLHGGMSQGQRERALKDFSRGACPVLVATNVAARGIHVDDVDIVVHHDPPEDAKTYLHRSGRTARAGAAGVVVTLVGYDQELDVRHMRREAGLREAIVPMKPGDLRLTDLAAWTPPEDELLASRPSPKQGFSGGRSRSSMGGGSRRGSFGRRPRASSF